MWPFCPPVMIRPGPQGHCLKPPVPINKIEANVACILVHRDLLVEHGGLFSPSRPAQLKPLSHLWQVQGRLRRDSVPSNGHQLKYPTSISQRRVSEESEDCSEPLGCRGSTRRHRQLPAAESTANMAAGQQTPDQRSVGFTAEEALALEWHGEDTLTL